MVFEETLFLYFLCKPFRLVIVYSVFDSFSG
jgi:hypothetical protein